MKIVKDKNRRVYGASPVQRLSYAAGVPDSPFIGDATPFFARCETELMTLSLGGRMGLLDLFNWTVSDVYTKTFSYLTYNRPAYVEGAPTAGHLTDPCADPNGTDFGTATITLEGFGLYGRVGPTRYFMQPKRYCETDPRYRLDGTPLTDEREWDMMFAMDVLKQDLYRHIVTGNNATPGQFDGLQQWINTGYDSAILDSMVVNWAGNNLAGTGGGTKTLNGVAIPAGTALINMILAIYRRFKQRIMWSPMLATQELREGSMVLALPTFLAECLLDAFTCWSVCPGGQYNETNLMTYEARAFRTSLLGGAFGAGKITLDGDTIHLFPYDWETIHGAQRGDIYFLTLNVGNVRLWEGEHLSASAAASEMEALGHNEYFATDGGRIIGLYEVDNLCRKLKLWIRPRLVNRAPWLQARIMNVECDTILDPLSPDPTDSSFYPVTSFFADQRLS